MCLHMSDMTYHAQLLSDVPTAYRLPEYASGLIRGSDIEPRLRLRLEQLQPLREVLSVHGGRVQAAQSFTHFALHNTTHTTQC